MRTLLFLTLGCCLTRAGSLPLWVSGEGGNHTYRIPALIETARGNLLAFSEARRHAVSDSGNISIVMRRSADGGLTWSVSQTVLTFDGDTTGNPAPVVDRKTKTVWLFATRNLAEDSEQQILARTSRGTRTVWETHSTDEGRTWSPPQNMTEAVKLKSWTWYATGPGAGIQLRSGRLMVACDHNTGERDGWKSHVIYSDDHGKTWRLGGSAGKSGNESVVAELPDGRLLLNMRNFTGTQRRTVAESRDGGLTWSEPEIAEALIDPVCHASLVAARKERRMVLVFANPASLKRENLTLRVSRDMGRTWSAGTLLHRGPAAYSSLAVLRRGGLGVLYEGGTVGPYESIFFMKTALADVRP